jgi:hypothetical protein
MGGNRHDPRRANGVRNDAARIRAVPLHDPDLVDTDAHEPIDLVAVQADDELINALSAGFPVVASGAHGTDDRVAAILAAWRAEVDAAPVPELVDVDTAVATITAAGGAPRRRSARARHLAPIAAAAAVLVISMGGVSIGSASAQPDDVLWPVSKVLFAERAASVEAADRVQDHIDRAKQALVEGRPDVAAEELRRARDDLGVVRPEEGQVELSDVQDFLLAKAAETAPGEPADLGAPLVAQPGRPVPPSVLVPLPQAVLPAPATSAGTVVPPSGGPGTAPSDPSTLLPQAPGPAAADLDPASSDPDGGIPRDPQPETTRQPDPTTEEKDPAPTAPESDPGTAPGTAPGTTGSDPEPTTTVPDRTEGQAPVQPSTSTTGTTTGSSLSGTTAPPT